METDIYEDKIAVIDITSVSQNTVVGASLGLGKRYWIKSLIITTSGTVLPVIIKNGASVRGLFYAFAGKPVVLDFAEYPCPSNSTLVITTISATGWSAGQVILKYQERI